MLFPDYVIAYQGKQKARGFQHSSSPKTYTTLNKSTKIHTLDLRKKGVSERLTGLYILNHLSGDARPFS